MTTVSQTRTLWDEGHEPGRQVIALGAACALTVVCLDLLWTGRVTWLFDIAFVGLCIGVALLVRPRDFFGIGVLPPLLMVGIFVLLGFAAPGAVARAEDSVIQTVVSGLAHHAIALVVGYVLCLGILAQRAHWMAEHGDPAAEPRDQRRNASTSPAP